MTTKRKGKNPLLKTIKIIFLVLGIIFSINLIVALTPLPFYMHYNLGVPTSDETYQRVEKVVMFGGAGMPSESNLMRLYYTAGIAKANECSVVVVHPEDSICEREMRRFLNAYGVEDRQIEFMGQGTNTRSQTVALAQQYSQLISEPLSIVTSPENMKRTLLCMRKVGFQHVIGQAAYEATVDFDLSLREQKLGGKEIIHTVESTNLRYTFWNYLQLEFVCFREYFALAYYKVKGWI